MLLIPRNLLFWVMRSIVLRCFRCYTCWNFTARRLHPGVFFGLSNDSLAIEQVRPLLVRGVGALKRLCRFEPFLLGEAETAADYMFMYSVDLAAQVAQKVYEWDLVEDLSCGEALLERLNSHPVAQRLATDKREQMSEFLTRYQ